jgi:lipopolysaccharide/colanic/teichoic acid biosynthesis glycosyltransferase
MQEVARMGSAPSLGWPVERDELFPREIASITALQETRDAVEHVQVDETRLLRRLVGEVEHERKDDAANVMTSAEIVETTRTGTEVMDGRSGQLHDAVEHGGAVPGTLIGRRVKRGVDIVGSLAALTALSPVIATCAAVVRLGSPGPILFRQKRIGQHGRPFTMLKFRTMYVNSDEGVHEQYVKKFINGTAHAQDADGATVFKLVHDARVTPAGRWLRRLSLDELPQLVNVLRGEMSLAGPRPPLPYEVEHYRPRDLQRFRAKPGITGLWQVSGRSKTTFEEMIDLDLTYIRNWSIGLDFRILQRTIPVVLFPDGQ